MLFNRLLVEKDETQTAPFATGSGNTTLFYTPHSPTPSQMHSREQFEIPDLGKMIFKVTFSICGGIVYTGDISELRLILNALFKN